MILAIFNPSFPLIPFYTPACFYHAEKNMLFPFNYTLPGWQKTVKYLLLKKALPPF
jgi:hypothetical protein